MQTQRIKTPDAVIWLCVRRTGTIANRPARGFSGLADNTSHPMAPPKT